VELTEIYSSNIPLWAVLVSLIAVPFILLSGKWPNLREMWTLIAAVVKFGLVLTLLPGAIDGLVAEQHLVSIAPGVDLAFRADAFGVFFAVIASGLWILTSFYSIGYMRGNHEEKQTRYFASFAVSLSATIGIAFSANLLTFILFYEMLTLATYPLVVHKENREAVAAGRQYLAYALTAGLLLVAGSVWVYQTTGTLDFQAGGILGEADTSAGVMRVVFIMFLAGVGVKAGIMPLHSWLPSAMVAPTPVSALLHAVAVVKSGVFALVRVVGFIFGPETMRTYDLHLILAVFAGATIILASVIALRQTNLKKRLAYSTVAHLSYIALGAALLSQEGFLGGILHISAHATMKITLFFCAGAIYVHTHKQDIKDLDGIGKAMPWTMGAFVIGSMGLAGLPPVNGFLSKWFLLEGSLTADMAVVMGVFLLSGLLNAAYFFPIIQRAFFRSSNQFDGYGEASPLMVVPLCLTGALSIVFFIFPNLFFNFYDLAVQVSHSITRGGSLP
jgi:multicomponent Na+:H+ antiporter subunit D